MHRARLLVLKANPDLAHASRERILITSFRLGLFDRQLASSLAVVKIQTAADAERLAAEGEAVRRDKRYRRSTNNFLPEEPSAQDPGSLEEPSDAEPLDEEEEELMAALGTLNSTRKNFNSITNPPEMRRATSTTKCYGCGQYGHFKSDCPRPNRRGPKRFAPRTKLESLLCQGNHFIRNCPPLPVAQQATERSGQARETEPQKQVAASSARSSAPNEPSATFKREGTAVLSESPFSDNQLVQADLPPSSEPTPRARPPCKSSTPPCRDEPRVNPRDSANDIVLHTLSRSDFARLDTSRFWFNT